MIVLHVLEPAIAGVPAYVDRLGRELAHRDVEQHVFTSDAQEWDFGGWASSITRHPWLRSVRSTFSVAAAIKKTVQTRSIGVVHAHASWAGLATRVRRLEPPIAYQPHGWGADSVESKRAKGFARSVEALLSRRTDQLLLLSDAEEEDAPRTRPVHRVKPLVDLSEFHPVDAATRRAKREVLGWNPKSHVTLCVGELSARKQQVELVRAWSSTMGRDESQLVIVGDGASRPDIERDLTSGVVLMGWRDDVAELMTAADSLVIASRGEGFSLVTLEALASGLPVHTTRVGGSEVIGPEDGTVSETVDDLAAAILSADPLLGTDEARAARSERTHAGYEVSDSVDLIEHIYRSMG